MNYSIQDVFQRYTKGEELNLLRNDVLVFNDMSTLQVVYEYPFRLNAIIMMACWQGSVDFSVNAENHTAHTGQFAIVTPDSLLRVTHTSDDFDAMLFIASVDYLMALKLELKEYLPYYFSLQGGVVIPLCDNCFSRIWKISNILISDDDEEGDTSAVRRSLVAALVESLRFAFDHHMPSSQIPDSKNAPVMLNNSLMNRFVTLLQEKHNQEHRVIYYADKLGLTPKYFSQVIRQMSGKSAVDWINEYVIVEAQNRLRYSQASIADIADELGFASQTQFCKSFKRLCGCTPNEYRKK